MGATKIEWATAVWNPVTGCEPCASGCAHCYAKRMATRLAGRFGYPADEPFKVTLHPKRLGEPLRWKKPRRVFTVSMGDLFHVDVHYEFVDRVFAAMSDTPRHTFLILTKRPDRMERYLRTEYRERSVWFAPLPNGEHFNGPRVWPLRNVWLGTSVSTQPELDEAVPHLLRCPAAVRFLSLEPLIEAVDLIHPQRRWIGPATQVGGMHDGIDWVIVGGESGPGARQCHVEHIRSVVRQCRAADVPPFIKQLGANSVETQAGLDYWLELHDPKGADPSEWPEDLRDARKFPAAKDPACRCWEKPTIEETL